MKTIESARDAPQSASHHSAALSFAHFLIILYLKFFFEATCRWKRAETRRSRQINTLDTPRSKVYYLITPVFGEKQPKRRIPV